MPSVRFSTRSLVAAIAAAAVLFTGGIALGALVFSGSGDRPKRVVLETTVPPPVTEAPSRCKPGALARAPWDELSGSVGQLLDLTGSVASYEPVDPATVGLAQAGNFALSPQSSGVLGFFNQGDDALALAQLTVASTEREKTALRAAAADEARLEEAFIGGLLASGVDPDGVHGPVIWYDMPIAGWDSKMGQLSIDFPEDAVGAEAAVIVGECGDNLVAVSSVTVRGGGVSSYAAHDVAGILWRRVEKL